MPLAVIEGPIRAHDASITGMSLYSAIDSSYANVFEGWLDNNLQKIKASHLNLSKSKQFERIMYRAILAKNVLAEEKSGEKNPAEIIQDILKNGGEAPILKPKKDPIL